MNVIVRILAPIQFFLNRKRKCSDLLSTLVQDRRALHRIPEIGYNLPKTRAYIKSIGLPLQPDEMREQLNRLGRWMVILLRNDFLDAVVAGAVDIHG